MSVPSVAFCSLILHEQRHVTENVVLAHFLSNTSELALAKKKGMLPIGEKKIQLLPPLLCASKPREIIFPG